MQLNIWERPWVELWADEEIERQESERGRGFRERDKR